MTTCPKSNSFVSADMKGKEITDLLAKGIEVSVNSDDPAYFGGYISENYWALAEAYDLSVDQVVQIAKNSFNSSWISDQQNGIMFKKLMILLPIMILRVLLQSFPKIYFSVKLRKKTERTE